MPSSCVMALGPVVTRARVLVGEVFRVGEFAERRRAKGADHARLEVEERRAGHLLAAIGLAVKNVGAVELRIVTAALLTDAADAVLVAHHLQNLGAHLATALARLHVRF